ncbi:MAG: hypothetical protein RQ826_05850 [Xanthomonadales bacterium]|nr:hypothetical protein [Xanthomonadales bacterium]
MSSGIVVVTHGTTGRSLIEVAESILGESLDEILFVPFSHSGAEAEDRRAVRSAMDNAARRGGILVMTDLIGASPSNLIAALLDQYPATLVTGLNLAMLIRVWTYRDCGPDELARKAVEGGRRGIKAITK